MISIIHPSRGRPEKSYTTIEKWKRNARHPERLEIVISNDEDDPSLPTYSRLYCFKNHVHKNKSAIQAINWAANFCTGSILIVVSDDTDCLPMWDDFILKLTANKTDWILKTNDGAQPWIITMPCMDRVYFNRTRYIYFPGYDHMFADTEMTAVADLTDRKITSNILFRHLQYSIVKEMPDAINKKNDATWPQGETLFLNRYKRNFDLAPSEIKGKIQDNGMIRWMQNKVR